jgi:hypothetical protein
MLPICTLYCFVACLIRLALQLLQMQILSQNKCTGGKTLEIKPEVIFEHIFKKCSLHHERFQIKFVDLKYTFDVPCQFFVLCVVSEKKFSLSFV